jgi:hypothetical protein
MKPEEMEKLLGGYATGTLSEDERRALFDAAVSDQRLFDALVREEALRELLADSRARQQVLEALGPSREPSWQRVWDWVRQPAALALAGSAAVAFIAVGIVLQKGSRPTGEPVETAEVRKPVEPPPAPPEPAPAPRDASGSAAQAGPARQPLTAPPAAKAPERATPSFGVVGGVPPPPARAAPAAEQFAASAGAGRGGEPVRADARDLYLRTLAGPALGFLAGQPSPGPTVRLSRREAASQATGIAAPSPDLAAPVPSYLGVRYRILRKEGDGRYTETKPAAVLRPGDHLRLIFEPNDTGYLYVLQREANGVWRLLWSGGVQKAVPLHVPPDGALTYQRSGRKELFVMLSRRPEMGVAQLDAAQLESLAARARGRLLVESAASRDHSVYVVDPTLPSSAQQVAFSITLEMR